MMQTEPLPTTLQGPLMDRRRLLQLAGAGLLAGGAATVTTPSTAGAAVRTSAHIVIVGAGAAGLAAANRLHSGLEGARITLIDRKEEHWYQPGFTLVAGGVWNPEKLLDRSERYVPQGINWIKAMVAEYDPDANRVVTDDGQALDYDYLVVATGLQLNYDHIEGMSADLIGRDGICSVYASPAAAASTNRVLSEFVERGGTGIFTRPRGGIKCAGAPLKVTFLTQDRLVRAGTRERARMLYTVPGTGLFSQPDIDAFVKQRFPEIGVDIQWHHTLKAIDPGSKQATFMTQEGDITLDYDYIHVVPPMSAPDALADSPLAEQRPAEHASGHWGPMFGQGSWLEVDRHSLRHVRYPNVFGIGDINGVPMGKTAASVKAQTPVAVENLIDTIREREPVAAYDGYTSCPLITGIGKAILVEFNYAAEMVPSFPFIDPYREHWVPWVMKDRMLQGAYNAMLRGRI